MTTITPTEEQTSILTAATETKDNLLISALAGAAKTSTLVMIANHKAMRKTPILCLAFNKKIAVEMQAKLPSTCLAKTLNALGHQVWGQQLGKRLRLSSSKNYGIVKDLIETETRKDLKARLYDQMADLIRLMAFAKSCGWVPDGVFRQARSLWENDDEFFAHMEEELPEYEQQFLRRAMTISNQQSLEGEIDFDDQIYMSTLFPSSFQSWPLVLIDEAQDLSALQHQMLRKMKAGRYIAVGDSCQAIYGFRGAHENSMSLMQTEFSMREFTLSISFRCPIAVVREAQWRAPHMRWPEWAKKGEVTTLKRWNVSHLPEDAVILCRNNAPIFSMAIQLLLNNRFPEIVGNDITKALTKILSKLGNKEMPQADLHKKINEFEIMKLSKARPHARGKIKDQCKCLRIFTNQAETLGGAIEYANHLMYHTGPIKLMTGHKSKGLEFNNVFILNRTLLNLQEGSQDRNLLYVMQTRAQENLTYITSDNFQTEYSEEETRG